MRYLELFLKNITNILLIVLLIISYFLYSRIQNMQYETKKQTQEMEEFKQYVEGLGKAEVKIVEKPVVKEVIPQTILNEMKNNREVIASLHKAVVELEERVGEGQSVDLGAFWEFDNEDLWAKTWKESGVFEYKIKPMPLGIIMVDSTFDDDLHKFRIQVKDLKHDTILETKDYKVEIAEKYFKDTHKKTLWSNKYVRLTAYTVTGVAILSLLKN